MLVVLRNAGDRKTGEIERDKIGGNRQAGTISGAFEGEIVDEFIRARLTDRLAFIDLGRSFFSPVLRSSAG